MDMRWLVRIVAAVVATLFALLVAAFAWLDIPATGAGLAAKNACSGVFLAGRDLDDVVAHDILPASRLLRLVDLKMDMDAHAVRARTRIAAE